MRKPTIYAVLICLMLATFPLAAQEAQVGEGDELPGAIAREFTITVPPGNTRQFEEAYKGHVAWHAERNDTWRWDTWQQISGPNLNTYVIRTDGHTWAELDADPEFRKADVAHFVENVAQFTSNIAGQTSEARWNLSHWSLEGTPAMVYIYEFYIRRGRVDEFNQALKKIKQAAEKTNWALRYLVIERATGGRIPKFVAVLPYANWADVEGPELSFPAMLEKGLGKSEAEEVLKMFDESIEKEIATMYAYRADLSYVPEGM